MQFDGLETPRVAGTQTERLLMEEGPDSAVVEKNIELSQSRYDQLVSMAAESQAPVPSSNQVNQYGCSYRKCIIL